MQNLNTLLLFAKVVETNSFSEAARRLDIPVSTVSRKIAELEDELGVRLLERSTRQLRLTEVGAEVLELANRSSEISESLHSLVSNRAVNVSGMLRISAPPSISDTLLTPLATAFQASYPEVRFDIRVTERKIDHITEGIDLAFRVGKLRDSTLVAHRLLRYRHQLVASPKYLKNHKSPLHPEDLLRHRLLAFSYWNPQNSWSFRNKNDTRTIDFEPTIAMNDYIGLATALAEGGGIGELPPIVQPGFMEKGLLVEVMPTWKFEPVDVSLVHLGNRHISRQIRLFKEYASETVPKLFPNLPI